MEESTHTYRWQGRVVPGVTELLRRAGLIPSFGAESDLARGRAVHRACWYHDEGDLNWASLAPAFAGYVRGWIRFKQLSGVRFLAIERSYYHPLYRFATTIDRQAILNGRMGALELKSGPIAPWVALQTAAHRLVLPGATARWAVSVTSEGWFELEEFADPTDESVFLSVLAADHWTRRSR